MCIADLIAGEVATLEREGEFAADVMEADNKGLAEVESSIGVEDVAWFTDPTVDPTALADNSEIPPPVASPTLLAELRWTFSARRGDARCGIAGRCVLCSGDSVFALTVGGVTVTVAFCSPVVAECEELLLPVEVDSRGIVR